MYILLIMFLLASQAMAEPTGGWHRFRGPNGSGIAEGCQPPVHLGKDCEAWRVSVPPGLSSPVLSQDRLFLTAEMDGALLTLAFDRKTGKELWRMAAPGKGTEKVHRAASQASSTPLVDNQRVIVYFGSYGLLCYDHDGKEVWKKPIPTPQTLYGMATSPIGFENTVIMVLDDDRNLPDSPLSRSRVVAFDKDTGGEVWETARPFSRSGWSTPDHLGPQGGSGSRHPRTRKASWLQSGDRARKVVHDWILARNDRRSGCESRPRVRFFSTEGWRWGYRYRPEAVLGFDSAVRHQ